MKTTLYTLGNKYVCKWYNKDLTNPTDVHEYVKRYNDFLEARDGVAEALIIQNADNSYQVTLCCVVAKNLVPLLEKLHHDS